MPNLFISGEALAMSEERLRQLGIGAIVACGCKSHFPSKFLYHEVHVQDNANAKIGHLLRPAANFIANLQRSGNSTAEKFLRIIFTYQICICKA